ARGQGDPPPSRSALEGVGDLEEQLAPRRLEAVLHGEGAVVAVAEEEHGLPVELVGEEGRAVEVLIPPRYGEGVESRIEDGAHPLADQAQEGAGGEVVGGL